MEMKSRFVQLCVDASIWSMVAILGLGCNQAKGRLLEIITGIRREVEKTLEIKEQTCTWSCAHY